MKLPQCSALRHLSGTWHLLWRLPPGRSQVTPKQGWAPAPASSPALRRAQTQQICWRPLLLSDCHPGNKHFRARQPEKCPTARTTGIQHFELGLVPLLSSVQLLLEGVRRSLWKGHTQSPGTLCSFIFNALKAWFEQMKSMGICHKFETTKLMLNYTRPFPSVFHPWLLTHAGQDVATKVQ